MEEDGLEMMDAILTSLLDSPGTHGNALSAIGAFGIHVVLE